MAVIGIDLGGTKVATGLFSADGVIGQTGAVPLAGRKGTEVGYLIAEQVEALLERADAENIDVEAVGISVPGIFRAHTGTVWAPNIPGWEDYPLFGELRDVMRRRVQVRIDSDRACSIRGEVWKGAAQGTYNTIFLAVGTGIGAGILVEGEILHGQDDIAGAIGWLALGRPYLPEYRECGCFEYHASGAGIAKVARKLMEQEGRSPGEITAIDVFHAMEQGDPIARRVIDEAVGYWGMAVANLVSLFNPEMIVFGGGVFGPAAGLLDRIQEEAMRWAQPVSIRRVTLKSSALRGEAALYGAAWMAFDAIPELQL